METPVCRAVVEAFYEAYSSRDANRIAPFIDDDARWAIGGPMDLLEFCGERRGKAAVLEMLQLLSKVFGVTAIVPEIMLVAGDRASSLSRITGVHRTTGRAISYRCAQFVQFRDNKVVDYRSLIDSLDAAEQLLGRRIDLTPANAPSVP